MCSLVSAVSHVLCSGIFCETCTNNKYYNIRQEMTKLRNNKDAQDCRRKDMEQRLTESDRTETVGEINKSRNNNDLNIKTYAGLEKQKDTQLTSRNSRRKAMRTG